MSTVPDELTEFVKAALGRGTSRDEVQSVLRAAGWPIEQVHTALSGYADTPFPIPVPRPRPHLDARDAFVYLVLFTTLYVSAYHLGSLLFDIINSVFPDPAESPSNPYVRVSMRWSIASLIVAFPVFCYTSWHVARELAVDPNKRHSKVRRWLTYLTLFVAATVLIGDVITLVFNVLGGEITIRFVLKVLVVGFIAATVFWYYLSDITRETRRGDRTG